MWGRNRFWSFKFGIHVGLILTKIRSLMKTRRAQNPKVNPWGKVWVFFKVVRY